MRFNARNAYYLRISANTVLPLYLYLDEQHIEWMSERVLQHVLADLRPLIPSKLIAEADAHLGPGGPANAKKGTLEVHRGDTYQFGYFLRNTEPHAIVIKTRKFTAAPKVERKAKLSGTEEQQIPSSDAASSSTKPKQTANKGRKNTGRRATKKRIAGGKGKQRARSVSVEDQVTESDDDEEAGTLFNTPAVPRRSTRKRKILTGGYVEEDDEDEDDQLPAEASVMNEDVEMQAESDTSRPSITSVRNNEANDDALPRLHEEALISMDDHEDSVQPTVKTEEAEPVLDSKTLSPPETTEAIDIDNEISVPEQPMEGITNESDILLAAEEEEEKPKPIMSLQYQGFSIHGRCLCVIVEPYPPIRSQRAVSLAPTGLVGPRAPSIAPPDFVPSDGAGQRARTPLFFPDPDYDRERSATPAPFRQRIRPPVPLFNEVPTYDDGDDEDGGMLAFSQILQSVGNYNTGAVEDDDEIDGSVFLGDADEARGL